MSESTNIQWADSTQNPVMGCGGCELYRSPGEILQEIDSILRIAGIRIDSCKLVKELIRHRYLGIQSRGRGYRNVLTTTNIWHLRQEICDAIAAIHGTTAGENAMKVIKASIICYAAKLHFNRGESLANPGRKPNRGYAPTFEQMTSYEGRMQQAARWKDLTGSNRSGSPWKNGLPRLIFVSDMGDAFSSKASFDFLESDAVEAIMSSEGRRHLWLWLTKRPHHIRDFAERIGGFPRNVCAMTTVTGPDTLHRIDEIRKVRAFSRGLSIEPLFERIPPRKLNLKGIDWVILGGESGNGDLTRSFDLAWARELRDHCRKRGVAFFLKQLGHNPVEDGKSIRLVHPHGGDWDEWPEDLRVREFPGYFHCYGPLRS